MNYNQLEIQKQPTSDSCTSACLAMLTGLPVAKVIGEFHGQWASGKPICTPSGYLRKNGIDHLVLPADQIPKLLKIPGAYLLTVPSLNSTGILHHIIVTFDSTDSMFHIFDPSKKNEYAFNSIGDDGIFVLSGYVVDLFAPSILY